MYITKIKQFAVLALCALSISACAALYGKETTGEYIDDTAITTKVKAAILNDQNLKPFEISVETLKGEVQLRGFVDSKWRANEAERNARTVSGVKSVKNNIIVRPSHHHHHHHHATKPVQQSSTNTTATTNTAPVTKQ